MPQRIGVVCHLSSKAPWAGVDWYVVLDGFCGVIFKWLLWINPCELVLDMPCPLRKIAKLHTLSVTIIFL